MITKANIKKVRSMGLRIDQEQAFNGKSKGNRHLFRVVAIARYLAKKTSADISVVESAAWLHDTALPSGDDYNYIENKKIVTKLLSKVDIAKEDKFKIIEAVASHEGIKTPQTLESQVVHDADVLEKTGILGVIRHTWKMTNKDEVVDIQNLVRHIKWRGTQIKTKEAKKIHKLISKIPSGKTLKIIVPIISFYAKKSVVTEKIAKKISKYLSSSEKLLLKNQLDTLFLK